MPETERIAAGLLLEQSVFESEIYGYPAARLLLDQDAGNLEQIDRILVDATRQWQKAGYLLISCRLPQAQDARLGEKFEAAGFRKIETLVTLERQIPVTSEELPRPDKAEPRDFDACIELAKSAFSYDRFHVDRRLPASKADQLKAAWVRNALNGRADTALVARNGTGDIVGFNLLLRRGNAAIIDLIAVAETVRGQGYGRKLVEAGIENYHGKALTMRAGTQIDNTASLALYRQCGFHQIESAITRHWVAPTAMGRIQ